MIPNLAGKPRKRSRPTQSHPLPAVVEGEFTVADDLELSAGLRAKLPDVAHALLNGANLSVPGLSVDAKILDRNEVRELKQAFTARGFGIPHNGKPYQITANGMTYLTHVAST